MLWQYKGFKSYAMIDEALNANGVSKDLTGVNVTIPQNFHKNLSIISIHPEQLQFNAASNSIYKLMFFSLNGKQNKTVSYFSTSSGIKTIPLNEINFSNGTYLIQIVGNNQTVTQNFIVTK